MHISVRCKITNGSITKCKLQLLKPNIFIFRKLWVQKRVVLPQVMTSTHIGRTLIGAFRRTGLIVKPWDADNYRTIHHCLRDGCPLGAMALQTVSPPPPPTFTNLVNLRNYSAARNPTPVKKGGDTAVYLVAVAVGMVGLTYAAVPLYRLFCQATGFGGTVKEGAGVEQKLKERTENPNLKIEEAAKARDIKISFNADVSDSLPWKFFPAQRSVHIHPGQSTLAFYTAHNTSNKSITGVSTYNVAPQQAGQYFNKVQCFCFEEQKLRPGEKVDMPVFFYIDPEFAVDPRMKGINNITLSYTFFKVSDEDD